MRPARQLDVQYRENMEQFRQWEEETREAHEQAIRNMKKRERPPLPYKLPLWVVILSAIAFTGALSWLFITLAFHLKG